MKQEGLPYHKIILALDVDTLDKAEALIDRFYPRIKIFKIGPILFVRYGREAIDLVRHKGAKVFLDLKFYDIPNTIRLTLLQIARLNIDMLTLHIAGGRQMLEEAVKVKRELASGFLPLLIGVTLLTSLVREDIDILSLHKSIDVSEIVRRRALLAYQVGLDGIVCSVKEVSPLRKRFANKLLVVCPGIKIEGQGNPDQKRQVSIDSPLIEEADYLVMGRSLINTK